MSKNSICPYCAAEIEICHDDGYGYEEDQLHEQSCWRCEKTFVYTTMIHFTYDIRVADCLNGAPHAYKKTVTFPPDRARMRCVVCGHERALDGKQ